MSKPATVLPAPGLDISRVFRGSQQYVLVPGAEAYAKLRPGTATLQSGNDELEVEVKAKFVGSLFSLVRDYGRESVYVMGQSFDPTMIFDHLEDNKMPIDPREVYTAVSIFIPHA